MIKVLFDPFNLVSCDSGLSTLKPELASTLKILMKAEKLQIVKNLIWCPVNFICLHYDVNFPKWIETFNGFTTNKTIWKVFKTTDKKDVVKIGAALTLNQLNTYHNDLVC